MTAQFQIFQSLPHKKADFVKKKPIEIGVLPNRAQLGDEKGNEEGYDGC